MSSSLSIEDRRQHEQSLLALYLDTLEGKMAGYSKEQAIADYRLSMIASLTTNMLSTAVLPRTPAANELILTLLKRSTAAVEDWDSLTAIRSFASSTRN